MPDVLYRTNGDKAVIRKSVISGTGYAIGKDYQPDSMHDGDIGITVRINREKLKGPLTPEQKTAAARIFREATQEVGAVLGEDLQPGFPPGTVVVTVGDAVGVVQSVIPNGLFLRRIDGRGKETTSFIPLTQRIDAVPDVTGMDGLLTAIARGDVGIREERGFLKFIIERIDDEETLFAAVTRPAAGYHGAYELAITKINDPIRLAKIIAALEKHDVAGGARNGREAAAIKLTSMIEGLTREQRLEIIKILEPTVDLSPSSADRGEKEWHFEERALVLLYLTLFTTSVEDAQTHLADMIIGKQDIGDGVRELIIREHLNDHFVSAIAEIVITRAWPPANQSADHEAQQCAFAIVDRLPKDHITLQLVVSNSDCEELINAALTKITDTVVLEKLLQLREGRLRRGDENIPTNFASLIWKRLRDFAPAAPACGGSRAYK